MGTRLTDAEVVDLREKYARGVRQVDLAAEYGISQNTVSSLVVGRSRAAAGGPITRSGARKLGPDDVVAIRRAAADGTPADDLATTYSVTQQMISNIVTGRAYRDVGGPLSGRTAPRAAPLTVDQVARIRERVEAGDPRTVVAAAFGISKWTVDSVMSGRLPGRTDETAWQLSREDVRRIRTLYDEGATQADIAQMWGTTQQLVSNVVRGLVYKSYGGPIAGPKRQTSTVDEVRRIREAFVAGATIGELAERHGLTQEVIRQMISGATYPSAPGSRPAADERRYPRA